MMLTRIPIVALMLGIFSLLMFVPAIGAAIESEWRVSRGFFYPAIFGVIAAMALGVLLPPVRPGDTARHELLTLFLLWLLLPFVASVPLILLSPALGVSGAWFEMTAALTTTGGSAFARASEVPDMIHLWRGMIGWLGGFMTLMAAYVILAPRRLGGFEVMATADGPVSRASVELRISGAAFQTRLHRAFKSILPVYLAMTLALGIVFNASDKAGLISAVHAMSIVSTSGISPLDNGFAGAETFFAEVFAVIFMILAATRIVYSRASHIGQSAGFRRDPELRLMAVLVCLATLLLFLRHWLGALTIDVTAEIDALDGLKALWGAFFTTVSFITTTGFESFAWESARNWSGLANPGLVLLGLCAIGGGAATTAGGIKLIRAYALIRHGGRELERIAMPNSVAGSGSGSRGLRREGAFIAWAFMMLYIAVLMCTVLALTLTGMDFTDALVASVAALSNTGPAFEIIAVNEDGFASLLPAQRAILGAAMILGRIETLAVIALFNPDAWRPRGIRPKKTGKS